MTTLRLLMLGLAAVSVIASCGPSTPSTTTPKAQAPKPEVEQLADDMCACTSDECISGVAKRADALKRPALVPQEIALVACYRKAQVYAAAELVRQFTSHADTVCACKNPACTKSKQAERSKLVSQAGQYHDSVELLPRRLQDKLDGAVKRITKCTGEQFGVGGSEEADKMTAFANKMCACNNATCAQDTHKAMMEWIKGHFKGGKKKGTKRNVELWKKAQSKLNKCYVDKLKASTKAASNADMLKDPTKAKLTAPATFSVRFVTTKGDFTIDVNRAWAPKGVDRFYTLVKIGYFTDVAFFRAVKGFVVQFGIHGDPSIATTWLSSNIDDDPVVQSNTRGTITFAKSAQPNSRSVQVFINFSDRNKQLDRMGFAPFGKVTSGMKVVEALYQGYGEKTTRLQSQIAQKGNAWLKAQFPKLDYIKRAEIYR